MKLERICTLTKNSSGRGYKTETKAIHFTDDYCPCFCGSKYGNRTEAGDSAEWGDQATLPEPRWCFLPHQLPVSNLSL